MRFCKQCGGEIIWKYLGGKSQCFNPDGTSHWDLCSKRKMEAVKQFGTPFKTATTEGYKLDGKKHFTMISGARIKGWRFHGECDCKTPPWELCPHSFRDRFPEQPLLTEQETA